MQLVEQGKIGLDTPAHTYIDPWLAKQNPPAGPLLAMWNSDSTIETVTVRHLLAMVGTNQGTLFVSSVAKAASPVPIESPAGNLLPCAGVLVQRCV